MASFTPTEEQQLLIDTIRRYANSDIRPAAHDADESETLPQDIVQTGWEIGLVPSAMPEDIGGLGDMSAITGALAAEELACGDLSVALAVFAPATFAYPIALYGTAEQRERYLTPFLDEMFVPASAALLEPGIFFDPNELKTTATTRGDQITLNGVKAYVPFADVAEQLLVYARDTESGCTNAYIVPKSADGVSVEKRERLMGIRALPTFRVNLNNVTLNAGTRLGGADGAFDFSVILNRSRVALAALAVGVARAASEYAREYAKQRVQFGVPVAQKQAVAFMLADMAIEVDAARMMVWEAAWKLDQGEAATREAYLAKQYTDKAVLFVTDSAVQTLGGYGFIREYPVERWLRNARGFSTFDGLAIL
jgi:acyl-CoA dehydrogenase